MSAPALRMEVGGVVFHLAFPPTWPLAPLLARYLSFLTDEPPAWHVAVVADGSLTTLAPPWIRHDGPLTRFQVMGHRGWVDLQAARAVVSTPSAAAAHSALTRTLSFICVQELPYRGQGLWLHGAGVVWRGRGYLFFGASGRGKSTVARLAAGQAEVLGDENAIVWLASEAPTLRSTPFWGLSTPEDERHPLTRRQVPLRALFALEQAPAFSLTRLSPASAVMELLASEKVATERVSRATAWLQMAEALVRAIPVYRLAFRPTAALWDFLAQEMAETLDE